MSESIPSPSFDTPSFLTLRRAVGRDAVTRELTIQEVEKHMDVLVFLVSRSLRNKLRRLRRSLPAGTSTDKVYFSVARTTVLPYYTHAFEIRWGTAEDDKESHAVPLRMVAAVRSATCFRWELFIAPADTGQCHHSLTRGTGAGNVDEATAVLARHMLISREICAEPVEPASTFDDDQDNFVPVDVCAGMDFEDK